MARTGISAHRQPKIQPSLLLAASRHPFIIALTPGSLPRFAVRMAGGYVTVGVALHRASPENSMESSVDGRGVMPLITGATSERRAGVCHCLELLFLVVISDVVSHGGVRGRRQFRHILGAGDWRGVAAHGRRAAAGALYASFVRAAVCAQ